MKKYKEYGYLIQIFTLTQQTNRYFKTHDALIIT